METQVVSKILEYGLLGIIVVIVYLRMMKAEDKVDAEKSGRLEDTKAQAALGVEFKNATMVLGEALQKNTAKIDDLSEEVQRLRDEVARSERRA